MIGFTYETDKEGNITPSTAEVEEKRKYLEPLRQELEKGIKSLIDKFKENHSVLIFIDYNQYELQIKLLYDSKLKQFTR